MSQAILTETDPTLTVEVSQRVPRGLVRLPVRSSGLNAKQWQNTLRALGYKPSEGFLKFCLGDEGRPLSSGGERRTLVFIPGWILKNEDRTGARIHHVAQMWRLKPPCFEDILLVCQAFNHDDFLCTGFTSLAFFHDPILQMDKPYHTVVSPPPQNDIMIHLSTPTMGWQRMFGFVFVEE